ncbi:DivIVA domain-containing protein [Bifidobacterium sp. ESL0732]|uniref:DivIVA domain-containing protein n=1 Tax=Bifidobacterium sp. ESL0732 TaxID=2983222 RepID=UPI0023F656B7|nr:DivIVA domain-containing protein [Bifidobacterium sp. ESL0732]WEV63639.1 DivIVA domain-containing protein [Bifidobacterium sp. ESL0732]
MAEESENNQSSTGIEYAGKRKWGYDVDQVNDFLERAHEMYDRNDGELTQQDIQSAAFTFTKGGYVIAEVDAALARLEHAVVDKETARQIAGNGSVAWQARTQQLYSMISAHAKRSHSDRFIRGERKHPSYDVKQVDRLIDQIITKSADDLGVRSMSSDEAKDLADLNSSTVANVIFTQRKGSRGYDERQVDYYLDACVQLLSRVESYARITDYNEKNAVAAAAAQPAGVPVAAPMAVPAVPQSQPVSGINNAPVSPLINSNTTAPFADPTVPSAQTAAPAYQPTEPTQPLQTAASSTAFDAFQTSTTPTTTGDSAATSSSTFDFNTAVSDTPAPAAPVIPNLPDGVGTSSGTTNATTPSQGNTDGADANSSLAALANMANTTQSASSDAETAAFTPEMPTFNTPVQGNAGNTDVNTNATSNANAASPLSTPDVDIPDISFPDFGAPKSDDQKTGE